MAGIGTTVNYDFDDAGVFAGTLIAAPVAAFRALGSWTSPQVGTTNWGNTLLAIYHSGLSASAYLDRVEVLEGTTMVWSTDVDSTSGPYSAYDIGAVIPTTQIVLYLAGDGTTSPTIEEVRLDVLTTGGGGGGSGGGGGLPKDFIDIDYPRFFRCQNVTFSDNRPEAALAILYIWSFGDGTAEFTTEPTVNHTYREEGLYVVTVRVQYRGGGIDIATSWVDTRGFNCVLAKFIELIFPILAMLGGLMALTAFFVYQSRLPKKKRERLMRAFLAVSLGCFGVIVAVTLYATFVGLPV